MPTNIQVLRNMGPYVATDAMAQSEESAARAIKLLLDAPDLEMRHRRQLMDIALLKFTEASGMSPHPKYNLRFVTDGARNLQVSAAVNHEHVRPRRWLLDELFAHTEWDTERITTFLRENAVACVVTVEEHALLGGASSSGWARYAKAGIPVWDRANGAYLDLGVVHPLTAPRMTASPSPSAVETFDLQDLIETRAGSKAPLLQRLTRTARFASAASVVAVGRDGTVSKYFRIHDAQLDEPTRAVAFPHWSGLVSFGLDPADVPQFFLAEPSVRKTQDKTYKVTCKVTDDSSLDVAEELLFLALEKLRGGTED